METIKRILNENKSLKILIPVLLLALIVLPIMYLNQPAKKPADATVKTTQAPSNNKPSIPDNSDNAPAATIMPGEIDTDYLSGKGSKDKETQTIDSSLIGPPEYKGALRGSKGTVVLLQFSNITKKIHLGDSIAGYVIKDIADDDSSITIEKNDIISVLQISPNSNSVSASN